MQKSQDLNPSPSNFWMRNRSEISDFKAPLPPLLPPAFQAQAGNALLRHEDFKFSHCPLPTLKQNKHLFLRDDVEHWFKMKTINK